MARFFGEVGYAEENVEVRPGIFEDVVTERKYFGDVVKNSRRFQDGPTVVDKLSIDNSISILADAYANERIEAMRYVVWMGVRWEIASIEDQRPRLLLRLGGVYNGPTPPAPPTP